MAGFALLVAVALVGCSTGVMLLYWHTIMPGLDTLDDDRFVQAFAAIDRAIVNPVFLVSYFGGLIASAVAVAGELADDQDSTRMTFLVAGLVLYAINVAITASVHVPRNNAIKEAGSQLTDEAAATFRASFDVDRWRRWHLVRTVVISASLVALLLAVAERL